LIGGRKEVLHHFDSADLGFSTLFVPMTSRYSLFIGLSEQFGQRIPQFTMAGPDPAIQSARVRGLDESQGAFSMAHLFAAPTRGG
jgi:hypothetical protein